MMQCEECRERIDDYGDARLEPQERAAFEAHLATCPACRHMVLEYQAMLAALGNLAPIPCPDEVSAAIHAAVRQRQAAEARPSQIRFGFSFSLPGLFTPRRIAFGLAAAAIFMVLGISLLKPLRDGLRIGGSPEYSPEQVVQADCQVKFALARIHDITAKTRTRLERDILVRGVYQPLRTSLDEALQPLSMGETK